MKCLLPVALDERCRPDFIVSHVTLVESLAFQPFVDKMLAQFPENIEVVHPHPLPEETVGVKLLAQSHTAPNRDSRRLPGFSQRLRIIHEVFPQIVRHHARVRHERMRDDGK